ncbi:MAG TPA: hypothetical protein DCL73_07900 [Treponema sp.]|nr:hypothetical protein [Treponema sp.]
MKNSVIYNRKIKCIIIFMLDYVLMAAAVILIIFALQYFIRIGRSKKTPTATASYRTFVNCPLCGSPLMPGEELFSKVFRPMTVNDQRCIIYGCPHCYPRCEPGVRRICPSCHKSVPADGHLVARLFNKTKDGKKHVVVTGCSVCCRYEPK